MLYNGWKSHWCLGQIRILVCFKIHPLSAEFKRIDRTLCIPQNLYFSHGMKPAIHLRASNYHSQHQPLQKLFEFLSSEIRLPAILPSLLLSQGSWPWVICNIIFTFLCLINLGISLYILIQMRKEKVLADVSLLRTLRSLWTSFSVTIPTPITSGWWEIIC